ncbi:MAG: GNAT family N-acetyltransferase [Lewinellaceae bacterium]|nr:GNAT family N-acetyltransferase [Phaeodactylibacter sp.]MCB9035115.1 GNAT family N-acetyltransferase [Lewinellaceae bacterium]
MFSRIRYPEKVTPEELDAYLAAGWRCMGQAIYTSHFMFFGPEDQKSVYSTIPARLPLEGYRFSRSHRKLWRRNERRFRIEVGAPARYDEEKQRVNRLYARQFPRRAIKDAKDVLSNGKGRLALDTREVKIYDGENLAAFSFFDMGCQSMYSKQGIYDPAYHKYSLGFFTMLVETQYALEQGLRYYYPGYVVPGNQEFDYKHRIGQLEYFELKDSAWKPFSQLSEEDIPINYLRSRLEALQNALKGKGIESKIFDYRYFDIRFYDNRPFPFLEFPCFLLPDSKDKQSLCPITVFDPVQMAFHIYNCRFFGPGVEHLSAYRRALRAALPLFQKPVAIFGILHESLSPEETLNALSQFARV